MACKPAGQLTTMNRRDAIQSIPLPRRPRRRGDASKKDMPGERCNMDHLLRHETLFAKRTRQTVEFGILPLQLQRLLLRQVRFFAAGKRLA